MPSNVALGQSKDVRVRYEVPPGPATFAFRLTGRNAKIPLVAEPGPPGQFPFQGPLTQLPTECEGSSQLSALFAADLDNPTTLSAEPILGTAVAYDLLLPDNPVVPPFGDPNGPTGQQAGALVSPFFYKDLTSNSSPADERSFYVEPSITDTTITTWNDWAILPPVTTQAPIAADISKFDVLAQVPYSSYLPPNPSDPEHSLFGVRDNVDWSAQASVGIRFGGTVIGQTGRADVIASSTGARSVAGLRTGTDFSSSRQIVDGRGALISVVADRTVEAPVVATEAVVGTVTGAQRL
jgi:hypothetical protein